MKNNIITDAKTALNIFRDMRKAGKEGREIAVKQKMQAPVIMCGGFYNTVEGCTLSRLDKGIRDKALKAFNGLPSEEKHRLQFAPEDGEFAERAHFWEELLGEIMPERQRHIAMAAVLHWYICIKRMGLGKGGAA